MKKTVSIVAGIALIGAFVLGSVFAVVTNRGFYTRAYARNDAPAATGVSASELDRITARLLDYLSCKAENLDMQTEKHGKQAEVFDTREKTHMIDVKSLYIGARNTGFAFAAVAAAAWIWLYLRRGKESFFNLIARGYSVALCAAIVLFGTLGTVFYFNFDWFWTNFHHVFFSNDLWLLDPAVSTMIQMFPLPFFLSMCTKILLCFGGCTVLTFILLQILRRKKSVL